MDLIHSAPGTLPLGLCQDRWILHHFYQKPEMELNLAKGTSILPLVEALQNQEYPALA